MASSISYQSGGPIYPSRFVIANPIAGSSQGDYQVIQGTTGVPILGISQEGTQIAPGTAGDSGYAVATSGYPLEVYSDEDNDDCLLCLGATVTGGQWLKSDTNGCGVPVVMSGGGSQFVGAEARESGTSGTLIRVRPRIDQVYT